MENFKFNEKLVKVDTIKTTSKVMELGMIRKFVSKTICR